MPPMDSDTALGCSAPRTAKQAAESSQARNATSQEGWLAMLMAKEKETSLSQIEGAVETPEVSEKL